MSKTIIVDNLPENFEKQKENGICIVSWYGDPRDNALHDLTLPLLEIAVKKAKDVREALETFKMQMIAQMEAGISTPILSLT